MALESGHANMSTGAAYIQRASQTLQSASCQPKLEATCLLSGTFRMRFTSTSAAVWLLGAAQVHGAPAKLVDPAFQGFFTPEGRDRIRNALSEGQHQLLL